MTDQINKAAAIEAEDGWLIHKAGRGWYRPNAQGYTHDPLEAGRYTRKLALWHSHPNGFDGPRDGMTIRHETEVKGALPLLPVRFTREDVEKVAVAIAKSDGLDYHEVCGVVADPDEGYCDSSTCVAACFEDHDPDQARGYYRHHATAALSAIGEVEHG